MAGATTLLSPVPRRGVARTSSGDGAALLSPLRNRKYDLFRVHPGCASLVTDMRQGSTLLTSSNPTNSLPVLDPADIVTGALLGSGQFGVVKEVLDIRTKAAAPAARRQRRASMSSLPSEASSREFSSAAFRPRQVVKCVRHDLVGQHQVDASLDLAREAVLLSALTRGGGVPPAPLGGQRPQAVPEHIVGIHGLAGIPGRPNFVVVLDRLDQTLEQKIGEWKQQTAPKKGFGFGLRSSHSGKHGLGRKVARHACLEEKLVALHETAQGMEFLHRRNLLFRDLKPANVGLDANGIVKLFDFGLARELKEQDRVGSDDPASEAAADDSLYNCTGMVGTRRYMAPEVWLGKPYGLKSDIYSFAMTVYHVLALESPCHGLTKEKHASQVFMKGWRPKLPKNLHLPVLKQLIENCWDGDSRKRPSMQQVCEELEALCPSTANSWTSA